MGKIKIKRRLWGFNPGEVVIVSSEAEAFAVRKGLAEPVPEEIDPIEPDAIDPIEPDVTSATVHRKPRRAPENKAENAQRNKSAMPDNI